MKEKIKNWPDIADKALSGIGSGLDEIGRFAKEIGKAISETAPQVWEGLVEYHRWKAIGNLSISILFTIVFCFLIYFYVKYIRKILEYKEDLPEKDLAITVISTVLICIISLIEIANIVDVPNKLADVAVPERNAAMEIIYVLKEGKLPNE